jgi:Resolvase, N terminal domain
MRKAKNGTTVGGKAQIRCAIYTRKSSEEGLEQDFNSLDAQREACEAFIRSQKHEGWVCLPEMYDDGGISGATMERPALKRILTDIEAGRIDAVVVYKVDRLTRSLNDFAKIVEVFDRQGVSFVSVTQPVQHHDLDGPVDAQHAAVLRPVRARGHRRAHPRQDRGLIVAQGADLARRWPEIAPTGRRAILATLIDRIDLLRETLEIRLLPLRLPAVLRGETGPQDLQRTPDANDPTITFTVPARLKRTGMETRLLIDGADGSSRRNPDYSLQRLLARAHRYNDMMMRSDGKTMTQLAAEAGVVRSYFTRILRLSFLAPEIVKAILRDRHPLELTAKRLANELRLPIAWDEQRALLGSS